MNILAAMALASCMTGSWFDADVPGEGIDMQVVGDRYLGYFYTYELDGTGQQTWFLLLGDAETGDGVIYDVRAAGYRDTLVVAEYSVGTVNVVPQDNDHLIVGYNMVMDLNKLGGGTPWCLNVNCADVLEYERLTQPIACE